MVFAEKARFVPAEEIKKEIAEKEKPQPKEIKTEAAKETTREMTQIESGLQSIKDVITRLESGDLNENSPQVANLRENLGIPQEMDLASAITVYERATTVEKVMANSGAAREEFASLGINDASEYLGQEMKNEQLAWLQENAPGSIDRQEKKWLKVNKKKIAAADKIFLQYADSIGQESEVKAENTELERGLQSIKGVIERVESGNLELSSPQVDNLRTNLGIPPEVDLGTAEAVFQTSVEIEDTMDDSEAAREEFMQADIYQAADYKDRALEHQALLNQQEKNPKALTGKKKKRFGFLGKLLDKANKVYYQYAGTRTAEPKNIGAMSKSRDIDKPKASKSFGGRV